MEVTSVKAKGMWEWLELIKERGRMDSDNISRCLLSVGTIWTFGEGDHWRDRDSRTGQPLLA